MKRILVITVTLCFLIVQNYNRVAIAGSFNYNTSSQKAVFSVYIDELGNKWFGTIYGLSRYDGSQWLYYTNADVIQGSEVYDIEPEFTTYGSEIWLATDYGSTVAAYGIDGISSATTYTTENGLFRNQINSVAIDTGHNKYFGMEEGISVFSNGNWDTINYDKYPTSIPQGVINDLATHNNILYVATSGGIGRFSMQVDGISGASRWTSEYGITPLSENILSVYIDINGDQWFGTDAGAEKHIGFSAKENWELFTTEEGLVNNYVNTINEDEGGAIWFGTNGGVSKFANNEWTNYTTLDGLPSDTVYDIDFDLDGAVWFVTDQGIGRLFNDKFEGITTEIKEIENNIIKFSLNYIPSTNTIKVTYIPISENNLVLKLYNLSGRLILTKIVKVKEFESGSVFWNIESRNKGICLIQVSQANYSTTKKILIK